MVAPDTMEQQARQALKAFKASGPVRSLGPAAAPAAELAGSCLEDVPVTCERPPPVGLEANIPNPGMPRASRAVSREKPTGTPGCPPNATVLQQHCLFWDQDGDGLIYPWDTYSGFRRLGFNPLLSIMAVPAIHALAIFSQPSLIPTSPFIPFHISRAHRTKHGSDSEVYDTEGRFVPEKFEEIFTKHDRGNKGGLDASDMARMVWANRNILDPVGWMGTMGEWGALWLLCHDEHGVVSKEKIRAQYDGSLWDIIAAEVEERRKGAKSRRDEAANGKGTANSSVGATGGTIVGI